MDRGNELTGPMSVMGVSSRTFSIWDFEGSIGGGLMRVPLEDWTIVECSAMIWD